MNDIKTREDIIVLVDSFYGKIKTNNLLAPIFNDVAKIDWQHHLPNMYDFWETLLLGKQAFKGNPMLKHLQLSKQTEMSKIHFDTWLSLWTETIDELYKGETAEEAKQKAENISRLMLFKIENL
jgi:hemoglobin